MDPDERHGLPAFVGIAPGIVQEPGGNGRRVKWSVSLEWVVVLFLVVALTLFEAALMIDFMNRRLTEVWFRMDSVEMRLQAASLVIFGPVERGNYAESFGDEPSSESAR